MNALKQGSSGKYCARKAIQATQCNSGLKLGDACFLFLTWTQVCCVTWSNFLLPCLIFYRITEKYMLVLWRSCSSTSYSKQGWFQSQTRLSRAWFSWVLKVPRDWKPSEHLFLCLSKFITKEVVASKQSFPFCSLWQLLLVLLLCTLEKSLAASPLQYPIRPWEMAIAPSLTSLFQAELAPFPQLLPVHPMLWPPGHFSHILLGSFPFVDLSFELAWGDWYKTALSSLSAVLGYAREFKLDKFSKSPKSLRFL